LRTLCQHPPSQRPAQELQFSKPSTHSAKCHLACCENSSLSVSTEQMWVRPEATATLCHPLVPPAASLTEVDASELHCARHCGTPAALCPCCPKRQQSGQAGAETTRLSLSPAWSSEPWGQQWWADPAFSLPEPAVLGTGGDLGLAPVWARSPCLQVAEEAQPLPHLSLS
jgi:hypothetical protein